MTTYRVGPGGDFNTLRAAAAAVVPGDTVIVGAGVYRENLIINVARTTWRGEPGAILDGGYSHAKAKTSGSSWRDLVYAPPVGRDVIKAAADNVTVEGLTVRNAPDSGLSAGGVTGLTVRGCTFYHLYGTGIKINGGAKGARSIVIEGNKVQAASMRIFDPTRVISTDPQDVSGSIKIGNAQDVTVRGNFVFNGFGEGINLGKNLRRFLCIDNVVANCNHKFIYCNSATDGVVRGNTLYNTGDPAHLWLDGEAPVALAVKDETDRLPHSTNIILERNLVVNCGIPFQIDPFDASGVFLVRRNTFVWGGLTRQGPQLSSSITTVEGNLFALESGDPMPDGDPRLNVNFWTVRPPSQWSVSGDVIAPAGFSAPALPVGDHDPYGIDSDLTFHAAGYRPAPDSAAVIDGAAMFGALEVISGPPDTTPPTVTIVSGPATAPATNAIFLYEIDEPAAVAYQLDADEWQPAGNPIELTGLTSGPHHLAIEATDAAGNIGAADWSWIVQPEPEPEIPAELIAAIEAILEQAIDAASASGAVVMALEAMLEKYRGRGAE